MSVIPQVYNQGTGLVGSAVSGGNLPDDVSDLIVTNTLTVLGETVLEGTTTVNAQLKVNGTLTANGPVDFTGATSVVISSAGDIILGRGPTSFVAWPLNQPQPGNQLVVLNPNTGNGTVNQPFRLVWQ